MDLQVKGIYWPNVASSSFARRFISSTIRHRYVGMPPALPVSAMAMAAQAWHIAWLAQPRQTLDTASSSVTCTSSA